jgi:hypothetical protein
MVCGVFVGLSAAASNTQDAHMVRHVQQYVVLVE